MAPHGNTHINIELNKSYCKSQWLRQNVKFCFKNIWKRRRAQKNHRWMRSYQCRAKNFVINEAMKAAQLPMIISHCAINFINDWLRQIIITTIEQKRSNHKLFIKDQFFIQVDCHFMYCNDFVLHAWNLIYMIVLRTNFGLKIC